MKPLLGPLRWMVLPLRECPSAPGQGALAIECRSSDDEVRALLESLHAKDSESAVQQERSLLRKWGGGCHQKFGATSIRTEELGELLFIRGRLPDQSFIEEFSWKNPQQILSSSSISPVLAWDGSQWKGCQRASLPEGVSRLNEALRDPGRSCLFIAHARALPEELPKEVWKKVTQGRVWTSGISSWLRLAKRGIWVEGCAEGLGIETLYPTLSEEVLQLPRFGNWLVLTHEAALESWTQGNPIATYRIDEQLRDPEAIETLNKATHIYWSSGSQFKLLHAYAQKGVHHACGPGKTAQFLRSHGVQPTLFPSSEEWKKWLNQ